MLPLAWYAVLAQELDSKKTLLLLLCCSVKILHMFGEDSKSTTPLKGKISPTATICDITSLLCFDINLA